MCCNSLDLARLFKSLRHLLQLLNCNTKPTTNFYYVIY